VVCFDPKASIRVGIQAGGRFAAFQKPDFLVGDLRKMFGPDLRRTSYPDVVDTDRKCSEPILTSVRFSYFKSFFCFGRLFATNSVDVSRLSYPYT